MRFRFFPTCAFVLLASNIVSAQTAGMVSFQGLIRDSGGTPIATPVSLEFRIFTADTGGSLVDMDGDGTVETLTSPPGGGSDVIAVGPLSPNGGIVSTKFGPVSPKSFAGCAPGVGGCRWLEVTVVGSGPLSRTEIVTPPGAAEQVNKLASGDSAIMTDANGNVGIGTTPETRLKVNGILSFNRLPDDTANAGFIGLEGIFPGRALSLVGSGTNNTNRRVHVFDTLTVGDSSGFQFNVNIVQNRVGIGTGDPGSTVSIRRDDDGKLLSFERLGREKWWVGPIGTGDAGLAFANESDGNLLRLLLTENGDVAIGTASASAKLHVAGNIFASGCTGCTSDARFKKNIATVTTALGKLLSLRGVWFQWNDPAKHGDESRRQMGMIAQEVEKVLPEWVMQDKDGYRYLNTNGFPALAVEAMREMKNENDALKNRVSSLESELVELRRMVNTISANSARGVAKP